MIKLHITKKKDGREVSWFRDTLGRRVRVGGPGQDWVQARHLMELGLYGIELQQAQLDAGLGSDGGTMPPLKAQGGRVVFVRRLNGRAQFGLEAYAQQKAKLGLRPFRDLYGPGRNGHMRDDIRINFISDRLCTFAITRSASRIKARANEQRAPWWGWSPDSVRKLTARAGEIFGTGMAEFLVSMGLVAAGAVSGAGRFLRRAA